MSNCFVSSNSSAFKDPPLSFSYFGSLKILETCHFWSSRGGSCLFIARGEVLRWKVRGLEIVTSVILLFFF